MTINFDGSQYRNEMSNMGILEMFQKFCEKLKDCIWFESLLFFKNNIEILFSRFFKDLILNLCLVWFDLVAY